MVYQIYYRKRELVLFDIEFYQQKSEHENTKGLWCSEIRVLHGYKNLNTDFYETL